MPIVTWRGDHAALSRIFWNACMGHKGEASVLPVKPLVHLPSHTAVGEEQRQGGDLALAPKNHSMVQTYHGPPPPSRESFSEVDALMLL